MQLIFYFFISKCLHKSTIVWVIGTQNLGQMCN